MRLTIAAAILAASAFQAQSYDSSREVDVVLSLVADISQSMSTGERELQRDGYAAAFRHREVLDAIEGGAIGCIAVSLIYFAERQREAVGWSKVCDAPSAHAFAARIEAASIDESAGQMTSIGHAMAEASRSMLASGYTGLRMVMDVSADGISNTGPSPSIARDAAVSAGITINGLPIVVRSDYSEADLIKHFEDSIIGGVGYRMVVVDGMAALPDAIRRKLVLEIAEVR